MFYYSFYILFCVFDRCEPKGLGLVNLNTAPRTCRWRGGGGDKGAVLVERERERGDRGMRVGKGSVVGDCGERGFGSDD